jgi:hypothetical protein
VPWLDRDDADIAAYVASLPGDPSIDLADSLKHWR